MFSFSLSAASFQARCRVGMRAMSEGAGIRSIPCRPVSQRPSGSAVVPGCAPGADNRVLASSTGA